MEEGLDYTFCRIFLEFFPHATFWIRLFTFSQRRQERKFCVSHATFANLENVTTCVSFYNFLKTSVQSGFFHCQIQNSSIFESYHYIYLNKKTTNLNMQTKESLWFPYYPTFHHLWWQKKVWNETLALKFTLYWHKMNVIGIQIRHDKESK